MNIKKVLLLAAGCLVSFLALLILTSVITKTATPKDLLILLKGRRSIPREAEVVSPATPVQQNQPSAETSNIAASPADSTTAGEQQKIAPRKAVESDMQEEGKKSEQQSSTEKKSLQQLEAEKEEKLSSLVRLYNSMDANKVVSIMDSLSDETAVEILSRMRTRQAAKVLGTFPPGRAARITLLMTQSKR